METLKTILRQAVDLIFGLIALGLLIAWVVNPANNFTGFLLLVVGYISFNIICKVRLVNNPDLLNKKWMRKLFLNRDKKY